MSLQAPGLDRRPVYNNYNNNISNNNNNNNQYHHHHKVTVVLCVDCYKADAQIFPIMLLELYHRIPIIISLHSLQHSSLRAKVQMSYGCSGHPLRISVSLHSSFSGISIAFIYNFLMFCSCLMLQPSRVWTSPSCPCEDGNISKNCGLG